MLPFRPSTIGPYRVWRSTFGVPPYNSVIYIVELGERDWAAVFLTNAFYGGSLDEAEEQIQVPLIQSLTMIDTP